jgi:hypothetical protein
LVSCANISTPSGGPKDKKEPKLIYSNPKDKSLNFESNKILLKFDEPIQEINDVSLININPRLKKTPEIKIRNKKNLEIIIKEPLEKNTTYSIYFGSSIKDVTEGNMADKKLRYTFSTGNFIDSISIQGKIFDYYNKALEKYVVAIYKSSDTLSVEKHKPLYLTKAEKDGTFIIENIKQDLYTIIAYNDFNNKNAYDDINKNIDFYHDLNVTESKKLDFYPSKAINNKMLINNVKQIENKYLDFTFNQGIKEIDIKTAGKTIEKRIESKGKNIYVYLNQVSNTSDSSVFDMDILDSNDVKHELKHKFLIENNLNKKTKKTKLIANVNKDYKKIERNTIDITFPHPISNTINTDSIYLKIDTNIIRNKKLVWNKDKYKLELIADIKAKDSIYIKIPKGNLIDINKDTLEQINEKIILDNREGTGIISGRLETKEKNIILSIINERNIEEEIIFTNEKFEFKKLKPGKYHLKIIIDSNQNKKWDPANLKNYQKAEKMMYYNTVINLKEDWEIDDIVWKF